MKNMESFWKDEEGMGTVEIVLIIAALVSMALIFKNTFVGMVRSLTNSLKGSVESGAAVESN